MLDPRQLESALTEKEILLRDGFVAEYLKDFDAYKACLRMGFQPTWAVQWAETLFNDGYVQRKISYLTAPQYSPDELKAKAKQRLLQIGLRGSDTASVAALRLLGSMEGWEGTEGGESEDLAEQFRRLAQALPT